MQRAPVPTLERASVREIARLVSCGARSAEQVARETLARADAYDEIQPQAWIARETPERVLAAARRVDARIASGDTLPLAGVPFAVKDNLDVAGLPTSVACPAFAYPAESSAAVVEQLMSAGAIPVGKTNLDQFATGLVGTRSPYGAPRCVFNREYVSGGSSSGSAVVVAAGVVPFALGSDTAGSGRVPAAFNHLVGLKPTRGRWSTRGLVPACRTLDCVSSLTLDAEDARLIDRVLTSFDPEDPYARRAPAHAAAALPESFAFAVPRPLQLQFYGDAESAALFAAAIERLSAAGGTPVEVDASPLLEAAQLLYAGPWVAERTAVLETLLNRQPAAVHPVVRAIAQAGAGVSAVETFRGLYALQRYARAIEPLFERAALLLLPTTPTIYRVSEVLAEPVQLNSQLGLYTNAVNLLDLAALAVPAGFRRNGTGFGVSLIAPAWSDERLLELAARLERRVPLGPPPPLDVSTRTPSVRLAVVGAHLAGMPLHWQLTSRGARLAQSTRTAARYRLYAMSGQTPPKPALVHVGAGGSPIEIEVYELELEAFGSFVAEVPPPLAIGTVELADGTSVRGFVAEPRALPGALDISHHGGWRAYLASQGDPIRGLIR
ncbi:MAG TPA: allophanate hydrolase [Steroidobacteraceae bacterium]|nr:allophanate hydrolase [Steroidobacteraceae bacterium]